MAISLIAVVEIASALARRAREGTITAEQRDAAYALFIGHTSSFLVVDMNPTIADQSARLLLAAPMGLRSLDALHVASANWAFDQSRRRGVATGSFVTADRALLSAAGWAGLPAVNPEDQAP